MRGVGGTEENNKREAIVCERCLIKKNIKKRDSRRRQERQAQKAGVAGRETPLVYQRDTRAHRFRYQCERADGDGSLTVSMR